MLTSIQAMLSSDLSSELVDIDYRNTQTRS